MENSTMQVKLKHIRGLCNNLITEEDISEEMYKDIVHIKEIVNSYIL